MNALLLVHLDELDRPLVLLLQDLLQLGLPGPGLSDGLPPRRDLRVPLADQVHHLQVLQIDLIQVNWP